ncbi:hypothetical protein vseg_013908 [Gypsophila vaccaria]
MVVTSPFGPGRATLLPSTTTAFSPFFRKHHDNTTLINLNHTFRSSNLYCCCTRHHDAINHDNYDVINGGAGDCSDWDWNKWTRHFSEVEQAEKFSSLLKFQLEEAIEKEDFEEAAKLKFAIAEASSKDAVAEILLELKRAIAEERYHDASKLSRNTGSGLVGWWVGSAKDSGDPFGRLVRITPGVGKFIARAYTPRQLVTASPGMALFEIYVVRSSDGTYSMQVVYLQRSKGNLTSSASLQPKPTRESLSDDESESVPTTDVDAQTTKDKSEKQEERVLNNEGATEDGIKSVINFLKDKIPGFNVKVLNVDVTEDAVKDSDALRQMIQEDSDYDTEDDSDELNETDNGEDRVTVGGNSTSIEDEKDLNMKVFIGGIVHSEDDTSSKEDYVRLPAEIRDTEKNSFMLHVPGIRRNAESEAADYKIAALAAQGASELMPPDVAKAFLGADKLSPKISRDVREIVKLAVSQAQKRNKISEYTKFDRIKIPRGNLDPFDGLYVGAFGPYGTEIVQLKRKFGRWTNGDGSKESSDIEFYEYVEAVKLTGDLNVPAGQVTFRAKIGKGSRLSNRSIYPDELGVVTSYKGQGRMAEFGFKNPKWVEGELLQLSGKGIGPYVRGADLGFLYIVPEQSFLVIFNRLNLPE